MQSDNIEDIFSGKNTSWGQWMNDSTFQTYPDIHVDHMIRFSEAIEPLELKLSQNAHLNLIDNTNKIRCYLAENSTLLHQGLPQQGLFYLSENARLEHHSISKNKSLTSRIEIFLTQPKAYVDWRDGIALGQGQIFDLNMKVDHVATETHSNCILKSIIKDDGLLKLVCDIFIQKEAVKCSTRQRNLNHILSSQGQIVALPRLHIFNRNIEASHGTATQPIPKDVLFYLQSRGLSKPEAEQTYLESFLSEIYHHE